MEKDNIRYIIISPVRNEEKNIESTIQSVISQTVKPMKWIIVDDGSSDRTIDIVEKYTKNYDWISLLKLPDRGYYDLMTGGEIKAFYRGYETIKNEQYDFLSKLDGDISFNEYYYEDLFWQFQSNEKLGIASGACYYQDNDTTILEKAHKRHVRGAARVYRKQCWDEIGGVIDNLGWDVIDVYKARMLGWDTYNFEDIKMIHHVITWTKGGLIHGRERAGRMAYLMGMYPLFFYLKAARELLRFPYIISACAYIRGYRKAFSKKEERVVSRELMAHIRKEQLDRIKSFFSNIKRSFCNSPR